MASAIFGDCVSGTSAEDGLDGILVQFDTARAARAISGAGQPFSVAVAVAVLWTMPASTSAWVTVCLASPLQVTESPGATAMVGQVTEPIVGSATATCAIVTLPEFVDHERIGHLVAGGGDGRRATVLARASDGALGVLVRMQEMFAPPYRCDRQ